MKKVLSNILTAGMLILAQQSYAQGLAAAPSALNAKQRSIVPISAFLANGNQTRLRQSLSDGLNSGLSISEIKEVLVQLYAYTGFPRSLNAIGTFEALVNERKAQGIKDDAGREPNRLTFNDGKYKYGLDVVGKLTGSLAKGPALVFAPAIDTFLKEHLFADIFGRDNLDYQSREIATISALASIEGIEGQLRSHLNAGRNVGLTEHQLREIASVLSIQVGWYEGTVTSQFVDMMFAQNASPPGAESLGTDIFPRGNKGGNQNFTGDVWVNMHLSNDTVYNTQIGSVTFAPGARTNWHVHPSGQILLITDGMGYHQEKGKPLVLVRKGDVIKCPPNVMHWHGGSVNNSMSHVAISPDMEKGSVKWGEKVSDEEYKNRVN